MFSNILQWPLEMLRAMEVSLAESPPLVLSKGIR